jgi:hypothetical protein
MECVLFHDVVHTDYGQFDVMWSDGTGFEGDFDKFFDGQINGLVGVADDGVYVNLARRSGGSRVRIVSHAVEPAAPDLRYEDVVEVSMAIPEAARVRWSTRAGEKSGELPGIEKGRYRLRVSAHGRHAGHDGEFADDVVDEYLLELWPAPVASAGGAGGDHPSR